MQVGTRTGTSPASQTRQISLKGAMAKPKPSTTASDRLESLKKKHPKSTDTLDKLSSSESFKTMNEAQKKRVLDVFDRADTNAQSKLVSLVDQQSKGAPKLLSKDSKGRTLLDNLHAIAEGPIDPQLAKNKLSRAEVLSSTITETAEPGQINQDGHGTCTVTTATYMLARESPAEYARVVSGLIRPGGSVALANGDVIDRVQDSIQNDGGSRSASERLFQAALMDKYNGSAPYSNLEDKAKALPGSGEGAMLSAVLGRPHDWIGADDTPRAMETLASKDPNGPPIYTAVDWNKGGHIIAVTEVKDGRVYFRNPWGPQPTVPRQSELQDPPRRMEDPQSGLESMTKEDFEKRLRGIAPNKSQTIEPKSWMSRARDWLGI